MFVHDSLSLSHCEHVLLSHAKCACRDKKLKRQQLLHLIIKRWYVQRAPEQVFRKLSTTNLNFHTPPLQMRCDCYTKHPDTRGHAMATASNSRVHCLGKAITDAARGLERALLPVASSATPQSLAGPKLEAQLAARTYLSHNRRRGRHRTLELLFLVSMVEHRVHQHRCGSQLPVARPRRQARHTRLLKGRKRCWCCRTTRSRPPPPLPPTSGRTMPAQARQEGQRRLCFSFLHWSHFSTGFRISHCQR